MLFRSEAMNVTSVESLAEMSDQSGTGIMGFLKFRNLAKSFLELRAGQAPLLKMAADLEARDIRIKELEMNNADILMRLHKLEESIKGAPGADQLEIPPYLKKDKAA